VLAGHLSAYDPAYLDTLGRITTELQAAGRTAAAARHAALGLMNQMLNQQAATLAYAAVFALTAVAAFAAIPLTLLFRGSTATGRR
jgi:hypothetical protein